MNEGFLIGCLIGGIVMTVLILGGLGFAQWMDKSKREEEIQARLNRALDKIREKECILEQEVSYSAKVASDLAFTKQICGTAIEQTLAYLEQTPSIFGDKKRTKIIQELNETLVYTGKERTQPVALLEHILSNGGSNEQSAING